MTRYVTITADPPWPYRDKLRMKDGVRRAAEAHYRVLTLPQIARFYREHGLQHRTAETAVLWLWITTPYLLEAAHLRICAGWGFTPRTMLTWVKGRLAVVDGDARLVGRLGLGHYLRGTSEHCILATRGPATRILLRRNARSEIIAPAGRHSEKPAGFYDLVESLTPGPYLELFARQRREGWDAIGDELDKDSRGIHTCSVAQEAPHDVRDSGHPDRLVLEPDQLSTPRGLAPDDGLGADV